MRSSIILYAKEYLETLLTYGFAPMSFGGLKLDLSEPLVRVQPIFGGPLRTRAIRAGPALYEANAIRVLLTGVIGSALK